MGNVANINHETFPKQGTFLHKRVKLVFHYDTTHVVYGCCIRDDAEPPYETIFHLDDGRVIRDSECQWSLI